MEQHWTLVIFLCEVEIFWLFYSATITTIVWRRWAVKWWRRFSAAEAARISNKIRILHYFCIKLSQSYLRALQAPRFRRNGSQPCLRAPEQNFKRQLSTPVSCYGCEEKYGFDLCVCLGWQYKASSSPRCQWMCFWTSSSKQITAKVCQLWWFSDRVRCGSDKESKAVPHREIYN